MSSSGYAASIKDEYELQERCGKRAEEVFKREFGNGISNTKDSQSMSGYENHFNKKLNKCFVLLRTTIFTHKTKKEGATTSSDIVLYDINENKQYGTFFKTRNDDKTVICSVSEKICHSESEWDAQIKPYMNE